MEWRLVGQYFWLCGFQEDFEYLYHFSYTKPWTRYGNSALKSYLENTLYFLSQGYFSQECWHICVSLSICIGIKWKLKWVDRLLFHAIVHTKNPSLLLFISMYTDFKNTLTQFNVNNCRRFNIVVIFKTLLFSVISSW